MKNKQTLQNRAEEKETASDNSDNRTPKDEKTLVSVRLKNSIENYINNPKKETLIEIERMAKIRKENMIKLLVENPALFIKSVYPKDFLGNLPPNISRDNFEHYVENLSGTTELETAEKDNGERIENYNLITSENKRLHVVNSTLPLYSNVKINGIEMDNIIAITNLGQEPQTYPVPKTTGDIKILVILFKQRDVSDPDDPNKPFSKTDVEKTFQSVKQYYSTVSYGKANLVTDVYGWYKINSSKWDMALQNFPNPLTFTCNIDKWAKESLQEFQKVNNISEIEINKKYEVIYYIFPNSTSCLGTTAQTIGLGNREIYINGDNNFRVFAHELGHSMGLGHAIVFDCPVFFYCLLSRGSDPFDLMRFNIYPTENRVGQINAFFKKKLGWEIKEEAVDKDNIHSGEPYFLAPLEDENQSANPQLITLKLPNNKNSLLLEFRKPIKYDENPMISESNNITGGTLIRYLDATNNREETGLIDPYNNLPNYLAAYLLDGKSWVNQSMKISITQISHDETGAIIKLEYIN